MSESVKQTDDATVIIMPTLSDDCASRATRPDGLIAREGAAGDDEQQRSAAGSRFGGGGLRVPHGGPSCAIIIGG